MNEERISYRQTLQEQIMSLITAIATNTTEHTGNIVVRVAEQVPAEDHVLFQSVARVISSDKRWVLERTTDAPSTVSPPLCRFTIK